MLGTDRRRVLTAATLAAGLFAGSCERTPESPATDPSATSQSLAGVVTVEGSSTVFPVSKAVADAFQQAQPGVRLSLASSTTADGLNKLCAGQVDIAAASRPINAAEINVCGAHDIAFMELPVAFDALSVVVNPKNDFVDCLTTSELKRMWEPEAQGKVMRWNDIRRSFPPAPLTLLGPDPTSGTFDYFTLAIVGSQDRSRADYTKSDDDMFLANAVAADPGALGYFGYSYYFNNRDRLKAVGIDNGQGCVMPSRQTVSDETYQPLSRPIFLYVSQPALSRPEVAAFARFAVSVDQAGTIELAGYVPLPPVTLLTIGKHLDTQVTGSIFGGRGAVLGVTANTFAADERVKNALVR
jgi:phosphate transport system substrate-binding protein